MMDVEIDNLKLKEVMEGMSDDELIDIIKGTGSIRDTSSAKGDTVAAVVAFGVFAGMIGFVVWMAMREDKKFQQTAEENRRKLAEEKKAEKQRLEDERLKAQEAASQGHTVLPNTDGTYWIIKRGDSVDGKPDKVVVEETS